MVIVGQFSVTTTEETVVIRRLIILGLLLLSVVMLTIYSPQINLKSRYFDQLDASVLSWLEQVPPVKIEVFAPRDSQVGAWVANFLTPLDGYWSELEVNYIDPALHPEMVRDFGINARGEMVVHHQDKHIMLSELSYETLFNGLTRLLNKTDRWTVILNGFGSQSLSDSKADGLGLWLQTIQNLKYPVVVLDWREDLQLPSDVGAIILPAPRQTLPNSTIVWLQKQLQKGVSLWWLTNPESAQMQPSLSLMFDVLPTDGETINRLTVSDYPEHIITKNFQYVTDWAGVMTFDTTTDTVLTTKDETIFAAAQNIEDSRLLVVGDSDFMNNSWLSNGGNRALSLRMLDWVLHQDERFNIADVSGAQSGLYFTSTQVIVLSVVLLLALPLFWLLGAFVLWIKKRQHKKN